MRTIASLLVLFGAACAHEAASNMRAHVMEQTSPTTVAPVQGAHVVMRCPDGLTEDLGMTDSSGLLRISPSTAPALDCKLTVARPGYAEQSTNVGDVCAAKAANVCTALNLTAVLKRSGSAGY